MTRRPVIGIIAGQQKIDDRYPAFMGGAMNTAAVAEVSGALPVLVPADPDYVSLADLLDTFDGFLLPGGRPNVHPSEYGEEETPARAGATESAGEAAAS